MNYKEFSSQIGLPTPYPWQQELSATADIKDRLIRIPTGFGKTLGVLSAWLWNRFARNDDAWPRRLVWCLPMRVLVEQTEAEIRKVLSSLGILWDGVSDHQNQVGVHILMGGANTGDWHLYPEECSILIGTQDMLLTRALNRGYGAARARWPMDFGLLNHDALWIMDEVQLMDVGLATSAQLQAFRVEDANKPFGYGSLRPCHTWWMSATLQEEWLQTVDTHSMLNSLPSRTEIASDQRIGGLWNVKKSCRVSTPIGDDKDGKALAELVFKSHQENAGLTLIVLNTVASAQAVYEQLKKKTHGTKIDLRLVHSRFRPYERKGWRNDFLCKNAIIPEAGRIIVTTQVIEAGVDISARTLITDLAPWPSLVQRFGRCARYVGESGTVVVLDRGWGADDEKKALPYAIEQILESKRTINQLSDVAPAALESLEDALTAEQRKLLYPYKPKHLLLKREWNELFDTSPDLSGADLDVSRFIRSGEENDCLIFWREIPESGPLNLWKPAREELCAVPFLKARDWLCGAKDAPNIRKKSIGGNKKRAVAWVWDWLDGCWNPHTERKHLTPGTIVLVDAQEGGYSAETGWNPEMKYPKDSSLDLSLQVKTSAQELSDSGEDHEALSESEWRTIAEHCHDVGREVQMIAEAIFPKHDGKDLMMTIRRRIAMAGFAHDVGKGSSIFQGLINKSSAPSAYKMELLAKAPKDAWSRKSNAQSRPGFRHELASALAFFDILRQYNPMHPALLGECAEYFPDLQLPESPLPPGGVIVSKLIDQMDYVERWDFDLVVYLIASHHGKVRCSLQASPFDQDYQDTDGRGMPIRGIREGDELPGFKNSSGSDYMPATRMTLEPAHLGLSAETGPSWTERVQGLLEKFGPSALAYMEALVRAADIRVSSQQTNTAVGGAHEV